jgi:hypothetical protein
MQAELGRKVDNGTVVKISAMDGPPGILLFYILVKPPESIVYPAVENKFRGAFLKLCRGNLIHEGNRVVLHLAPEMGIQVAESVADKFRVPCPPEIISQSTKTLMKITARIFHSFPPLIELYCKVVKTM